MTEPLPPRFTPAQLEPRWQSEWESHDVFRAPSAPPSDRGHFTIVLPPPNVTGTLTFGHSLGGTCMDVLVRWNRMKGVPTLWLPGVDHAGLATQMAVRKHLEKSGVNPTKLSPTELSEKIEEWRQDKESYIRRQLTAHGFSLDWSRYVYTLDPRYSGAVREAFLRLYREGVVYRAERMVNWDPKALTALSDLEVIPTENHGNLWYIRYPGTDGSAGITVATTRPETMFGDVAVAVNPGDERHAALLGSQVRIPLTDRTIPVVADTAVDPAFGNGALKITPSHDPVDHEVALRHPELPARRDVLDERAHLAGEFVPPEYRGMERFAARKAVVAALRGQGVLVKEEPYTNSVGYSERSDVPIEPRLSTQWFVNVEELGRAALASVREGRVQIHPESWTKTYYHFMENLKDWCISRQIIWGHPIPVWYCSACGAQDAYADIPDRCSKCGGGDLRAETDVLDTWFSSWLWPFATLGWPGSSPDLASYYPVSVLVTGSDILFFWVARMIMGGLHFTGKEPFRDVYLHGILVDKQGRKLSKHLGNSPDPLELIEQWGADTFRFALLFPMPVDHGGYWDHQKMMEGSRNFLTKLWNMVRFLTTVLPPGTPPASEVPASGDVFDRWILSALGQTLSEVDATLAQYDFTRAATVLHQFVWHEVADWYLEARKGALKGEEGADAQRTAAAVALFVMDRSLRMLQPMAPHVTEELWHALPHEGDFLARAAWPADRLPADTEAVGRIGILKDITRAARTLRKDAECPESARPILTVRPTTESARSVLASAAEHKGLLTLGRFESLQIRNETGTPEGSVAAVVPSAEIFLPRQGTTAGSRGALEREAEMLRQLLDKTRARLDDPGFRSRAPAAIVQETEAKVLELSERLRKIESHLSEASG